VHYTTLEWTAGSLKNLFAIMSNTLGKRLIKDEVVVEAAHTPAPHAGEPGGVKILGASHAKHRGQLHKGALSRL